MNLCPLIVFCIVGCKIWSVLFFAVFFVIGPLDFNTENMLKATEVLNLFVICIATVFLCS